MRTDWSPRVYELKKFLNLILLDWAVLSQMRQRKCKNYLKSIENLF